MLLYLTIRDIASISALEIDCQPGMTVITGDSGAGKSIILDALGFVLGDRADAKIIAHDAQLADIHASFDISGNLEARDWLQQRDWLADNECLLRRVLSREGRSRAYINGHPTTLHDLKTLGDKLIDIHSQHAHHALLKKDQQQRLLDAYAGITQQVTELGKLAKQCQHYQQQLDEWAANSATQQARIEWLQHQIDELDSLALAEGEINALDQEQQQLANGEQILQANHLALTICQEGEPNVIDLLNQALRTLNDNSDNNPPLLIEASKLLDSALIQVEEASHTLQQHRDHFELDPQRLQTVENRLTAIHDIARKHRVPAEQLPTLHQQWGEELQSLHGSDTDIAALREQLAAQQAAYQTLAANVSEQRQQAAHIFEQQVAALLDRLAMSNCRFTVKLTARETTEPHAYGQETIEFLLSSHPKQPPQRLATIASGGELSRIGLAIQVVAAQTAAIPTLVFDEVDVGIGGKTAAVVGELLHQLGSNGQVFCVTHQPQVAAKGDQHWCVSKQTNEQRVTTYLQTLLGQDRIDEIARMLGGLSITEQSLAHAVAMLELETSALSK